MGYGPLSSDSETVQKTNQRDESMTLSDQALAIRNTKSGNFRNSGNVTYEVQRGGTLTITNDSGEIADAIAARLAAQAGSPVTGVALGTPVNNAINGLAEQKADDAAAAPGRKQAIIAIIAIIALLLLGSLVVKARSK